MAMQGNKASEGLWLLRQRQETQREGTQAVAGELEGRQRNNLPYSFIPLFSPSN